MIVRNRKCKIHSRIIFTLLILVNIPHKALSLAAAPVDYLIPPPLVPASTLSRASQFLQRNSNIRPTNLLVKDVRTIPHYAGAASPNANNSGGQGTGASVDGNSLEQAGFMTRVARWFGFNGEGGKNQAKDQQMQATQQKQAYFYAKPLQQQHDSTKKEPCNLCNQYPWVPVMPNSLQYPAVNQWDPTKLQNHIISYQGNLQNPPNVQNLFRAPPAQQANIQHSASNIKQRAVQFNFPPPNLYQVPQKPKEPISPVHFSSGPFLPIPIPNLNQNAVPQRYNAQPYQQSSIITNAVPNGLRGSTASSNTLQQLPFTEPAHFSENIGAHSEIHADTVIPTQIPATVTNTKDASFEIIKSHQLVDYVSSVEYPASYVQTQSFDISPEHVATNHKPLEQNPPIITGRYQHGTFSPHLNQHIPASEILSKPGNFAVEQETAQDALQTQAYEQTTNSFGKQPNDQFKAYPIDNYSSASTYNSSVLQTNHYNEWTLNSYATSASDTTTEPETTTATTFFDSTTEDQLNNEVEFLPSIQTDMQNIKSQIYQTTDQKPNHRDYHHQQQFLDSSIQHVNGHGGAPRPFTKDSRVRAEPSNHRDEGNNYQWSSASPTPTSTSAIDASGQYAGMPPPSPPTSSTTAKSHEHKNFIIPSYSTKNRPRPFESTRDSLAVTKAPRPFNTWTDAQNTNELHTPQESMLVRVKSKLNAPHPTTTTTTAKPRTTKYLTKILASNLRELLQREHESNRQKPISNLNSLNVDIYKLQKNIDDWTEQEYTSLSHRPSTPTIRGRSKHIPSEYLPTTTAAKAALARQSKTTKVFQEVPELPASINSLETLLHDTSGKTTQSHYPYIEDNHLLDFNDNYDTLRSKTIATSWSTQAISSSTTTTTTETPLYFRTTEEPEELWKKAKVSISPQTKEKVYVVTPQPRFFPQRTYATTSTTTEQPYVGFKSPRFLIRPTPGNGTDAIVKTKDRYYNHNYFTPEVFGLKGLSAYMPAEPVHIIDGNSKVLTIVTAPSNLETNTPAPDSNQERHTDHNKFDHSGNHKKTTISPSPR